MAQQQYATTTQKKFLDADGLTYFSRQLNNYPSNDLLEAVIEGINDALDEKVDKVSGKGLSTNDYTTNEQTKLSGIETGAQVNVQSDWSQADTTADDYIKNKPTIGAAAAKAIDTSIENGSTSVKLPTSRAVAEFVEGKGYVTITDLGIGEALGLATLDAAGKVPISQLPSYVDDVEEYATLSAFPEEGLASKIYIALNTNLAYRWSGTTYVEISPSIALGETSSTAYAGDKGAAAYAHAVTNKGIALSSGLYKITTNSEGHVTAGTAVSKEDITILGIPSSDTTYIFDGTYNASTNKAATVSTVTNAINALDGNLNSTTPGAGKTLTGFSQTDGIVSATFGNISITKSQVSDLGTIGAAAAKAVDSSISAASESTNLPTSAAVAAFVEGKGYVTTDNNTTYTLTQSQEDGHILTFASSAGASTTITIPDNSSTYGVVTDFYDGLMSTTMKAKLDAISAEANKSDISYDTTNKKLTKTIDGTTTDVVSATTLKSDMSLNNVENKSSATIRSELTSSNVTTALGFTPLNANLGSTNSGKFLVVGSTGAIEAITMTAWQGGSY